MTTFLIIGAVVVAVGLFLGRRNIARLFNAGQAQATAAAMAVENADPTAMLQLEIDRAAERLGVARQAQSRCGAVVESLKRQIGENNNDLARLQKRVDTLTDMGKQDEAAAEFAKMQDVERSKATNEDQMKKTLVMYNDQLALINKANADIASARAKAREKKIELDMAKARKEAMELSSSVGISGGLTGDLNTNLGNAMDALQRKIDEANGSAQVVADLTKEARESAALDEEIKKRENNDAFQKYLANRKATTTA